MTIRALLMAGGQGTRMAASGASAPKPLVEVGGATLLERNVFALLAAGLVEVTVSVPRAPTTVREYVTARVEPLVVAAHGRLCVLEEEAALGNIGCAALLDDQVDALIVVYADNITTLDLGDVLATHERCNAGVTFAAHECQHVLPYGRLTIDGDEIVEYVEKPALSVVVSSAVTVMSPTSIRSLAQRVGDPPNRPAGLVDLFRWAREDGLRVVAHRHSAPWADVNDLGTLRAAEDVVALDPRASETWWAEPVEHIDCTLDPPLRPGSSAGSTVAIDDVVEGRPARYVVHADAELPAAPPRVDTRARFHLEPR